MSISTEEAGPALDVPEEASSAKAAGGAAVASAGGLTEAFTEAVNALQIPPHVLVVMKYARWVGECVVAA